MALTYKQQVESYVGTVTDVDVLSQYLTVSARRIVDLIPTAKAQQYAVLLTVDALGSDTTNMRVLEVTGGGYSARQVPHGMLAQIADNDSIFKAVTKDPIFYTDTNKLYVSPSGTDRMLSIPYPVVLSSDSDILSGVTEYDEALTLGAAIQVRSKNIEDARSALPASIGFLDVTNELTQLNTSLATDQDIELAVGWIQDIQVRIAEYSAKLTNIASDMQKAVHTINILQLSMASLEKRYQEVLALQFGIQFGGRNDSK